MESNNQLVTRTVDLLAPSDHFGASSRRYGQLHRHRLLLGKYWWVLGCLLLAILGPAYVFTAASPPAFESRAKMWLAGKLNFNESRLYTEELVNFLGTQAELLRSRAIQEKAMIRLQNQFTNRPWAKLNGSKRFPVVDEWKRSVKNMLGLGVTSSTNAVADLPFRVKVIESPKSSLLELRVTGPEPASSRAFLDQLMDEYLVFKREARETTSDRTVVSATGQLGQLAQELKAQQEKMYAFQMSNNVVFLQEQGSSAGSYLALLNKQLAGLRTELQLLELLQPEQWMELAAKSRSLEAGERPPGDVSSQEMLASLAGAQSDLFKSMQQIQLLMLKREELSRALRPLHPKMVKLNEEIAAQEALAQVSRDQAMKQLVHRREALKLEIQNLETAFQEWDSKAIQASRKMVAYDRIRQDLQRLQGAYDKLLGVIQTVDFSKTIDQENMSVLEPASLARPLHRTLRNMAIALLAALLLAGGLLYGLSSFDDSFASRLELANAVSEVVVGQIPEIALKRPKAGLQMKSLEGQRFEFLESFRSIRSSLLLQNEGASRAKSIAIASSAPDEGKSTVALYLAATLSLGGSRVLLVDADLRRGFLHKQLGVRAAPGLAEILNEEISTTAAIVPTLLENLAFVPAGEAKRNPGELVLSPRWSHFLNEIYGRYDFIVIDTPPILATEDAVGLASETDGMLFVVRGSFTSARVVREGLEQLRRRRIPVLGLIFNRAVSSFYQYHHYARYKEQYSWRPRRNGKAESAAVVRSQKAARPHDELVNP